MVAQKMIRAADRSAAKFQNLKEGDDDDRLLIAEILLRRSRTGGEIDEVIEEVDPDCKISAAGEEIVRLHADEPIEGILGVVCYLVLNP